MLNSKPKNPIIIEGFPGFGLVGTIATEYLIKHLDAKQIGFIRLEEIPPVIAVHNGQAVEPLGIFYSKEKNIVIMVVFFKKKNINKIKNKKKKRIKN